MSSLTLHPNLFQLFQPVGGVLANPLSCADNSKGAVSAATMATKMLALIDMCVCPSLLFSQNEFVCLTFIFSAAHSLNCFLRLEAIAPGSRPGPQRSVDCRITSLGSINIFFGRSLRLQAIRSSKRLAARFPISNVP